MATLLEQIKQTQDKQLQKLAPQEGQTAEVQRLMQAKSGKQVGPGGGSLASNLAEKRAIQQGKSALQQIGQQSTLGREQQSQQLADIAQSEKQQKQEFNFQKDEQKQVFDRQAGNVIDQFKQGQRSLDNTKDIAKLEQAGFETRLSTDSYVNELQNVGQRARLDDEQEFNLQLANTMFEEEKDLFANQQQFLSIMAADDREFDKQIANMSLDWAIDLAKQEAKDVAFNQQVGGLSGLIETGAEGYAKGAFKTKAAPSAPTAGSATTPAAGG